jgi:hypothetical protein
MLSGEVVHTISGWYDGPRTGAADFEGKPYWYRSVYLDSEIWYPDEDRFELTPLTEEALSWELETKRIFERWDAARKDGSVVWNQDDEASFGAMPEDMSRYRDLIKKLEDYLSRTAPEFMAHGNFNLGPRVVRWDPINPNKL